MNCTTSPAAGPRQARADGAAGELARALRGEKAAQARITSAEGEAEDMRKELEHMREAFSRWVWVWANRGRNRHTETHHRHR